MARSAARKPLTVKMIENAKPVSGKRVHLFDTLVPGLAVRITENGAKTFTLVTRFGGKQKWIALGRFGVMSLAEAREEASAKLRGKAKGEDPAAKPAPVVAPDSFKTVAEEFNKRHLSKRRSGPERWAAIERVFIPKWGARPITSIKKADVLAVLDEIEDAGTPYARNRRLADVRKLFNWAQHDRGIVDSNPASRISLLPEARRERVLTDAELRAFWTAAGEIGEPFGPLFRLLLLTGQRRDEGATIEKPDVDRKAKLWTIPGDKTKNGVPHTVPLAPAALDLLADLDEWEGPYLFTTTAGERPVSGFARAKEKLDAKMLAALRTAAQEAGADPAKVKLAPFVLHDLRRTAATRMGELGVDRFIIGRILNHTDRAVTGIYDRHAYDREKRRALERWARHLAGIVEPRAGNVVEMPGAA